MKKLTGITVVGLLAIVGPAAFAKTAVGYPLTITDTGKNLHWAEYGANYGNNHDSTVKVTVKPNGEFHVRFIFSNGNRLQGEDYYAKVTLYDEDRNKIASLSASAAINGTGGGKTKKEIREKATVLTPEEHRRAAFYVVEQKTTDPDHTRDTIRMGKILGAAAACYYGNAGQCATAAKMASED